jgi:hypothetical protein
MTFTEEEKNKIMLERMKSWELEEGNISEDIKNILEVNLPDTHNSVIEKLQNEIISTIDSYYEES